MKLRWILALAVLFAAGCLLIPDDQREGSQIDNLRPEVRITAGAATPDSAGIDYKVLFQWLGSDDDGLVLRFEYAVDDTSTEGAWEDTTGFSTLLRFQATNQFGVAKSDSFSDWHTFYIRAVDNEYATSRLDHRFFNVRTIAPKTKITFPRITSGAPSLVRTFVVEWEGEDLDSSQPDQEPEWYEYKLIRMPSQYFDEDVLVDSLLSKPNMLLDTLRTGDKTRWIRVPGDTRERILRDLQDTGPAVLIFGLRGVDEAGAVEPVLERGDNWIMFHVQQRPSQPNVTIRERSLGSHLFPTDGNVWEVQVPTNTLIRFEWFGDASSYGSKPGNVNYGLDVPDPEDDDYRDPRGIGGWIGWGKWEEAVIPLEFPDSENGQTHIFYVRMRDVGDLRSSERLCTVLMKVVAFTLERPALLVDDAKIGYGLLPGEADIIHDEFIERFVGRMNDFSPQGIDRRSMYKPGGNNLEGRSPNENDRIPLDELARYGSLLWSFNFGGGNSTGLWLHERPTRLAGATESRRMLSSYLAAGGKLFLFGGRFLSALMVDRSGIGFLPDYPKLPPQAGVTDFDFAETDFVWRFLHVRNQIVGIDKYSCYSRPPDDHQQWRDGLVRCNSVNPAYPDLVIDPAKFDTEAPADCGGQIHPPTGGIKDYEGILFDRQYSPFFPEAGLDTLYVSEHYSWEGSPPSHWNGSVVAQRYESTRADTLRGLGQGRVILFMFQPYPFVEGPAVDAGTAAINWLMTGQDY